MEYLLDAHNIIYNSYIINLEPTLYESFFIKNRFTYNRRYRLTAVLNTIPIISFTFRKKINKNLKKKNKIIRILTHYIVILYLLRMVSEDINLFFF